MDNGKQKGDGAPTQFGGRQSISEGSWDVMFCSSHKSPGQKRMEEFSRGRICH